MDSIILDHLSKSFGEVMAVDEVSLAIKEGELFGLLGPNGAGKTTIINMLITLLRPTSGTATIDGYDLRSDPDHIRRSIGIVFQDPSLDKDLTGRENLDFHVMMYGMPAALRKQRIDEVLDLVDLSDKADVLVEHYSGGMKRRLEIARGLVHNPRILFLDEPTLGLDAQTRRKIWEYIRNLNRKYRITVVLTTHYMEEADHLCDRIAIIDHGKIIALDTPLHLKSARMGDKILLEADNDTLEPVLEIIKKYPGIESVETDQTKITVHIAGAEQHLPKIIARISERGIELRSASLIKPSLEEVFIQYTGSKIREETGSFADKVRTLTIRRSHS
jgi:daunorubicin resistance ABC transporter ATP-binding subunit